jgi:hypothetical protein
MAPGARDFRAFVDLGAVAVQTGSHSQGCAAAVEDLQGELRSLTRSVVQRPGRRADMILDSR